MAAILVIGAGAFDLGLLAAAATLPGTLIAFVGGGWVDRHRRRPMLIGTDLIRAGALATIPLAAWAGMLTLPLLLAVAAVNGVARVLFELADHVYITDLVGRKRLLDANGKREAVDAIAEISGPALGGALVGWLTAPFAIAVDAASFVVSAFLVGRIDKREATHAPPPATSMLEDIRTGVRSIWRLPPVRALFLATAVMTFVMSFMAPLYTLYALSDLHLTPTQLGIAIGCGGIGGLVGATLAAPVAERFGVRRTLLAALLVGAVMQVLIPLAPPVPSIAMMFLVGTQVIGDGALTVYLVNETTLRQRLLPPEALGRAAAAWQVANGLLTPVGALAGAVLAETIGMRPTLFALAGGLFAAALCLYAAGRDRREVDAA
jgi:MFS family permease